jgi:hypothetical protein
MARRDLYLDTSKDVELSPRPYFSADELHVRAVEWCFGRVRGRGRGEV